MNIYMSVYATYRSKRSFLLNSSKVNFFAQFLAAVVLLL